MKCNKKEQTQLTVNFLRITRNAKIPCNTGNTVLQGIISSFYVTTKNGVLKVHAVLDKDGEMGIRRAERIAVHVF